MMWGCKHLAPLPQLQPTLRITVAPELPCGFQRPLMAFNLAWCFLLPSLLQRICESAEPKEHSQDCSLSDTSTSSSISRAILVIGQFAINLGTFSHSIIFKHDSNWEDSLKFCHALVTQVSEKHSTHYNGFIAKGYKLEPAKGRNT